MVELNFQAGDEVKLRLALDEIEGMFLESSDSSIILLKLESGYNIGIPKENILGSRVIKKYKEKEKELKYPERKEGLPFIGLVVTGGTIASKLDSKTGGVKSGGAKSLTKISEFIQYYPDLFNIVNVAEIRVPFMIASESMDSSHWIRIAEEVKHLLSKQEIKGVVVTHGTDTLHYTAAALSFFLKDLGKPVVLTYSQRSIDRASSDDNFNLQCAVKMAISDCAEVVLVGHATINDDYCYALRGTKVRKMHSSRRDTFQPINCEPIAKIWPDKVEFISKYKKRNDGNVELDGDFTDKVALIKFYPGQNPSVLDFYALKYKGIVVEATGLGHIASNDSLNNNWLPALKKHIRQGLIVCIAAQTIYGRVDSYVYTNLRELYDTGAIFLEDMLPETALIKLGFVLGHYGWKAKVKEKMLENMAGELNSRLTV